ncbi:MAG: 3-hydroxyacyl-CoA dehydrogenase NAD-binding domain-containing protein, partial [Pseudomonadales bacterium]|nr:3-hydroxyacyl-CoA dehydrogenase NAD-binding domain-containing protein [Pseudomonadales bacterium]
MSTIQTAAIIGGGVIGAGWVARFIENSIDVAIYDPASDAVAKIEAVLQNSRYAYNKLTKVQRK